MLLEEWDNRVSTGAEAGNGLGRCHNCAGPRKEDGRRDSEALDILDQPTGSEVLAAVFAESDFADGISICPVFEGFQRHRLVGIWRESVDERLDALHHPKGV